MKIYAWMFLLLINLPAGDALVLAENVHLSQETSKLGTPVFLTVSPRTNEKVETIFAVNDVYDNPYDPDEVMIDAVITCPDGDTLQVPCFYYIPASYKSGSWVRNESKRTWMLRFISSQAGSHLLKLKIQDHDGFSQTDNYSFIVAAGSTKGIIRNDTADRQYYRYSTGEPFYPLGINIGWNSIGNYTKIINNLSTEGANIFRYWHTPFAEQALEWKDNSFYDGLGHYNQEAAAMTDSLLTLCGARDVYMQLVIFQHGMFSENVDEMWADNPYNIVNGGFIDRAEKYFYNDQCKAQAKKLLRYIVARWAWSKNLFAWEFFNEVQFTGIYNSQTSAWFPGVLRWHSEMSRYLASIDPWDHIRTTSAANEQLALLDTISTLDNLQYHLYIGESLLLETQTGLDQRFRDELINHSVINGEYGTSAGADMPFDMQRNAIWNGIMTQVPRYMWIWSHYLQTSWASLFSMPALYLSDEDLAVEEGLRDYEVVCTHPTITLKSYGLTTSDKYYGYIYDPANGTDISGAKIVIRDLPVANYDLTWYLPASGEVVSQDSVAPVFWNNTFDLPVFSKGLAFKLKYRSEYTAPFARAGNDTVMAVGGTARLSAAASSSKVSDTLTYLWRIKDKPAASELSLSDSTSMIIEITPDVTGTYTLSLTVNDGHLESRPDEIKVRLSTPPVAFAGNDTSIYTSSKYVRLNGSYSYDPDEENITYQWMLLSSPEGSNGILIGGEESGQVTLDWDSSGWYVIRLTVNDGFQDSQSDTIAVNIINTTGINEIFPGNNFLVFPNPTTGKLYISCPVREKPEKVEVFDTQGKMLMLTKPDILAQGIYNIDIPVCIRHCGPLVLRITGNQITDTRIVLLVE